MNLVKPSQTVLHTCSSHEFSQLAHAPSRQPQSRSLVTPAAIVKMHCFICVTYMLILCSARPPETKELSSEHQQRSLFRDVIESLRIRTHLPEDFSQNDENNLSQNDDRYYESDQPQFPSDADFIPRRNDRLEMPSLKYRLPKNIDLNDTEEEKDNHEVVVYIETSTELKPTKKPNKRPHKNREENIESTASPGLLMPFSNTMAGQSHIGDRETQTVVKPTVIVNLRGTVNHRDSDIRVQKKQNYTIPDMGGNVFNVKQEVNLYRAVTEARNTSDKNVPNTVKQEVRIVENKKTAKKEDDMMMCETAGLTKNDQKGRNLDVLQILFSV